MLPSDQVKYDCNALEPYRSICRGNRCASKNVPAADDAQKVIRLSEKENGVGEQRKDDKCQHRYKREVRCAHDLDHSIVNPAQATSCDQDQTDHHPCKSVVSCVNSALTQCKVHRLYIINQNAVHFNM